MKYVEVEEVFDSGLLDTMYPPSVYHAYCVLKGMNVEALKAWPKLTASKIDTYYVGYFATRKEFIHCYILSLCGVVMPSQTVVDHDATWENLKDDFLFLPDDEEQGGGWYFEQH